jgi:hypothetical protein
MALGADVSKCQVHFRPGECEYWEARVDEGHDLAGRIWTDSCLPLIRSGRADLVEWMRILAVG